MEPNLTILIQAFNFFAVYLLFRYLLFKPAVAYLKGEEKTKKHIEQKISNQQASLDEKIEEKNETWKKYQVFFRKHSPQPETTKLLTIEEIKKEPEILELSQKEIDHFSEHMKKALIERVQSVK